MTFLDLWRRWTTPAPSDQPAPRGPAVVLKVLGGFVVLSFATQVLQWLRFAADPDPGRIPWWVTNLAVGLVCIGLLVLAHRGRPRTAAQILTVIVGGLGVLLLLADGTDRPMWATVLSAQMVLAVTLLGGREALAAVAATGSLVVAIVILLRLEVVTPFLSSAEEGPTSIGGTIGIVAVFAFVAFVWWVWTRSQPATPAPEAPPSAAPERLRERTALLSAREEEVVKLVADGLSNDAIAAALVVSPRTVQAHVASAMRKAGCANRTELGVLALREGLVPLDVPSRA